MIFLLGSARCRCRIRGSRCFKCPTFPDPYNIYSKCPTWTTLKWGWSMKLMSPWICLIKFSTESKPGGLPFSHKIPLHPSPMTPSWIPRSIHMKIPSKPLKGEPSAPALSPCVGRSTARASRRGSNAVLNAHAPGARTRSSSPRKWCMFLAPQTNLLLHPSHSDVIFYNPFKSHHPCPSQSPLVESEWEAVASLSRSSHKHPQHPLLILSVSMSSNPFPLVAL